MIPTLKVLKLCTSFRVISRSLNFKTRNPPEPHFDRKRMLEVCKPIYMPERLPDFLTCKRNILVEEEDHPYDIILSKELKEKIDSSRMILIYHVNSLTNKEKTNIYRSFFKADLQFHIYDSDVLKLGFDGIKYQALFQLFQSSTGLVFGPEIAIDKALKVNKQLSDKISLLAGIVDDRLYSKTNLNDISQVYKRNIHGEMVQNIRAPMTNIYRSLNYQMNLLSYYLKQISKDEK